MSMYERFKRVVVGNRVLLPLVKVGVRFRDKYQRAMRRLNRSGATRRYLDSHQVRKLQIGAGANILEGWLNTDIYPYTRGVVYLDAKKSFPFRDRTFGYIFSEHLIEHLTYKEAMLMLRECYRVLKAGGKIRLATPDLEVFLGLFAPEKTEVQRRYIRWNVDNFITEGTYSECFVVNSAFRNYGHQFIYDQPTLREALEKAGFVDITCFMMGESEDVALRGIESHGRAAGNEDMVRFETMVLEAKRPM